MEMQDKEERAKAPVGPAKGDFIAPPDVADADERADVLPQQEEFWRPPVRFGSVPVEKEPLGWDRRRGFRKLFPQVMLPFQVVERVSFGHARLEPNRLFWGDNLHVMRQLPTESIDLIYLDPPFFSGRQYNVIFGDQNELRSFSDIWEGGMPGYLIWLNARLYEMKRLLKKTGSIYVHCDWHASHYIKVELDKIFGSENFINEIIWHYTSGGASKDRFSRKHDIIFWYSKGDRYKFNTDSMRVPYKFQNTKIYQDEDGTYMIEPQTGKRRYYHEKGKVSDDVFDINFVGPHSSERIGYPTQKPLELIQKLIDAASEPGDLVADFFMGGGTWIESSLGIRVRKGENQQLIREHDSAKMRKFIGCDQSRVAVAITADRLTRQVEEQTGKMFPVPDFTVEHWGVYETQRLAQAPPEQFRAFVLRAFGAVPEEHEGGIHGYKGAVPVWVGEPDQKKAVTAQNVQDFSNAIRKTLRYKQDNLRDGIMLVDTTATPDRADGKVPDSDMIYEYSVTDALADAIIKTPVVYQPDIKTVQLTYTDAKTGEKRKVEEIDWDEVDRLGLNATQWVTDDEPMRQQMAIALRRVEEQERRAKGRYQPILFVVAVCKADAEKAESTLSKYFKVKTLLVTEDSDEADRQNARELGKQQKTADPYKAVVSVLMLREGWDVPEVSVILLLRKFGSKVYGQQVVGRGLRRVRVKRVESTEPQICAVVDHPKLEHQWLWDIFNAKKRVNVLIDQEFDETEDLPPPLPKQELKNPELVVDIPPVDPSVVDDGKFDVGDVPLPPKPLENWKQVMEAIEYDPTVVEITKVGIAGVVGQELGGHGWKTIHSAPDPNGPSAVVAQVSDEAVRDAVKERLLEMAETLTVEAGYAATFKDRVYSALLHHIRAKLLNGSSLGLAERADVDFAWRMLPQVKTKIASIPGLIAGIIEHAD